MMTLNEFIKDVNFHEHYRIYQPNRDCLIFESYYKVHSPYTFTEDGGIGFNDNYWDDNDFCDDVRHYKELDEETKTFLKDSANTKSSRWNVVVLDLQRCIRMRRVN